MDDHDLLVRIDERVGAIHNDIEEIKATLASHNRRLGILERWRAYVLGAAVVVATLISIVAGIMRW